jgi:hypothetical protein
MRRAELARCRDCGAYVWRGLDHDWSALTVQADTTALSPVGEVLALLRGRTTYRLSKQGTRYVLTRRDRWSIKSYPAGAVVRAATYDVIADHRCRAEPLPSIASQLDAALIRPKAGESDDQPSY